MSKRIHQKTFQQANYHIADERVLRCVIRAVLAYAGLWYDEQREFKRKQLL